ncbi:hypothetical protein A6E15_13910 [Natrinema saccharevitans]|uniref:Uncharacterized protein n=1 Tax=Natrinema saccharevitans TaxID=301967 RepID=A0A1S8AZI7_9EURY|nr:hypothetical protein [Natrinema saccharevitans]OLZ42006.1 hypothetical protein A6E15_13910 [Natrinema saccharevitans]
MGVSTFLKQNYVSLFLNIVLVPILSVLTYLSILSPGMLAILVVLANILPKYDTLVQQWQAAENRDQLRERTTEFNQILESFETKFEDEIFELKALGSENLINYAESVAIEEEEDIYLPLLYIYLEEESDFRLESHERTSLSQKLQMSLDRFSLVRPTNDDIRLAWGAYQLLCGKPEPYDLAPPDEEFMESECFKDRFIHEYIHKETIISKLTSEREEEAEYRSTLSQLYDGGKLSKYGIQQALIELEEDLNYVLTDKTHYFILINEMQHDTKIIEDIKEAVLANGDDVYTGSMMVNAGMTSLTLCVCDENWGTNEFYERFVKEPFEQYQEDGVLSLHRAKFEGGSIFKQRYEESEPSERILRGIEARGLLTTGEVAATLNLKEKLIESHLSTDELLSVLPLNLFLPDLPSTKKETLIEENEVIKRKFGIDQLTDWAHPNYTAEEIGQYLHRAYFPEDSEEEWVENAEKIIEEAKQIDVALT